MTAPIMVATAAGSGAPAHTRIGMANKPIPNPTALCSAAPSNRAAAGAIRASITTGTCRVRSNPASVRSLHDEVAASGAAPVAVDAVAVVALLRLLHDPVATIRAEHAAHVTLAVAAVVDAVVALLTRRDDAVATHRDAVAARGVEALEGQAEGGAGHHAFGVEERDPVHLLILEPEGGGAVGVDGHAAVERSVQAAKVDRQATVHEHPDVVVTREVEGRGRPGVVLEVVVHLGGEVEVVRHRARHDDR